MANISAIMSSDSGSPFPTTAIAGDITQLGTTAINAGFDYGKTVQIQQGLTARNLQNEVGGVINNGWNQVGNLSTANDILAKGFATQQSNLTSSLTSGNNMMWLALAAAAVVVVIFMFSKKDK